MVNSRQVGKVRRGNALGIFFVALSTLVLEITLTRVFSVTLWYHFGALAVSLAMFGIGASGVFIYVLPSLFPKASLGRQLSALCSLFALSIAVCFYIQLRIEFVPDSSFLSIATLALLYMVTAVPFFLSGLCVSLLFTHLPDQIGKLYFMDLIGAGLGCFVAVAAMSTISAPDVVLLSAVLAGFGGLSFATTAKGTPLKTILLLCVGLACLFGANNRLDLYRLDFVKGEAYERPEYEKWNSYSYVGIREVRHRTRPFGWGLSDVWTGTAPPERGVRIDAGAGTVIVGFNGDLETVEFLKYDVTSIAHNLFEDHKVLIIGAGGGRDILAALAFGADSVSALEYNAAVVEAANDHFAEFSGGVYELPGVKKIIAEGRSYVQRSTEKYDLIQASLVDSWAANASGAYVMAENFLYTREAFSAYFDHLTDRGVLSISRYNLPHSPQLLRITSIAMDILEERGIVDARDHLLIISKGRVGTLLMSREPFTKEQAKVIRKVARRMKFEMVWPPVREFKNEVEELLTSDDPARYVEEYPFDITPPTDDKPFFFHMANSPKAFRKMMETSESLIMSKFNIKWYGTFVLVAVLLVATVLAALCILLPLYVRRSDVRGIAGMKCTLAYFSCLGLGFMLIEIPLMQRLILFLGHPIYALSVVLFSLLVFAGCGSYLSSQLRAASARSYLRKSLGLLIGVLVLYNFLLPPLMGHFLGVGNAGRIGIAILALFPLGILLGMPLPLGMRVVADNAPRLVPWVWGVNGACSVFASLFAIIVAMSIGFTWAMLGGTAIYLVALLLTTGFRE